MQYGVLETPLRLPGRKVDPEQQGLARSAF
jgi:hypothetical protein